MVSSVQGGKNVVSFVHPGKIVWCLLSTVAKKKVVSFVHPGKKSLVSFGSGVFCPTFYHSGIDGYMTKMATTSVAKMATWTRWRLPQWLRWLHRQDSDYHSV